MLTILMPVFNERATLPNLITRIRAIPIDKEILIVDDYSTDGTRELLQSDVDGKYPDVHVLYHDANLGKGAAIRTAIPHAAGKYCIIQDGDLEYWPEDYIPILHAFLLHENRHRIWLSIYERPSPQHEANE
jgi:dolichol-phosphate mannosyltransferase